MKTGQDYIVQIWVMGGWSTGVAYPAEAEARDAVRNLLRQGAKARMVVAAK